jgi:type IV pilus assembly protein PilA
MRAYKRYNQRGFTLVELMIVVAIIGVLAALAIYGVRRYLASAKTSEAKNTVGAISRGAASAFERETTGSEILADGAQSTAASHALCNESTTPAGGAVPAALTAVQGRKYQPNTTPGADFDTGDSLTGWKCLKFTMTQPIYYQYTYKRGNFVSQTTTPTGPNPATGAGPGGSFEAAAQGDLDADTTPSSFARGGTVNANGQLVLATQVFTADEYE